MIVRPYRDDDEEGWLRCRALSFLHTAFFDDVRREKERYENRSVELVAEENGEIVGLIDVELDGAGGGMIWHSVGIARTASLSCSRVRHAS